MARVKRVFGVRLKAPNDPNGNPRRCWVVFDRLGNRIDCIDEGYVGMTAFTDKYPGGAEVLCVPVAYRAYKDALQGALGR
jgi:hypothetical protein